MIFFLHVPPVCTVAYPSRASRLDRYYYSIYADRRGSLALHCSGFSWIAALYPPLWAVPRRLWLACLGWLVTSLSTKALLLALLFHLPLTGGDVAGVYLGAVLIECWVLGRFANSFHRWWLRRHGYVLIAAAPSAEGAVA